MCSDFPPSKCLKVCFFFCVCDKSWFVPNQVSSLDISISISPLCLHVWVGTAEPVSTERTQFSCLYLMNNNESHHVNCYWIFWSIATCWWSHATDAFEASGKVILRLDKCSFLELQSHNYWRVAKSNVIVSEEVLKKSSQQQIYTDQLRNQGYFSPRQLLVLTCTAAVLLPQRFSCQCVWKLVFTVWWTKEKCKSK